MLFSVASSCFTIMWQSVQMSMIAKCHIRNTLVTFKQCKGTNFSRNTIKTSQLSAHIYYTGLGTAQPRGPNYMLYSGFEYN